jgi:ABC-2 type transport system permease protein
MIGAVASAVRPYQAVLRVRFQLLLQYRAAAIAGFVTQCWWGAIKVMVLAAFFRETVATPMTLSQAIDYTWLGQALLTLLPWSVDPEIARMVRSGDVAYERLRPLDTYTYWYARAVARRTATPLLRAIPMVITAGFVLPLVGMSAWGLSAPASSESLALFVVSMVLVIALSSAVATLMEVLTVATLSDRGVNTLIGPLIVILSGSLVPLPLYPEWLQPALRLQPFAGLLDTPLRIYTGHLGTTAALAGLVRQAVWIAVLVVIGRVLMARVMARLQAQGG